MTTADTTAIPDDIREQIAVIDKALASAMAHLALGQAHEMLMQLVRAQELSHSLNFRLESDLLPPGSPRPVSTLLPLFPLNNPSHAQQALL